MPNYTLGSTRVSVEQPDLDGQVNNGSLVLDSRRTRPLWFDGRFLAARDLEREQNYFLQREADLGQAAGFESLQGLMVDPVATADPSAGSATVIIRAGYGVTPAGELVSVPNDVTIRLADLPADAALNVQFGLAQGPPQATQKRSGLFLIALRPVEFTANPVTAFPTNVQGPRSSHDGDIVEATAISLIQYPNPPANVTPQLEQAAVARQIFLTGSSGKLSDALLPLAVVRLDGGNIIWLDSYMLRRGSGLQLNGVSFGLSDPATQQAFLTQYDGQLQSVVTKLQTGGQPANFAAKQYFQTLPPVGRFPLDAVKTAGFTQVFFPQQMDVRLSIVCDDELPALLEQGMSLPPIDLTLPDNAYANIAVLALVPVSRDNLAALKKSLPAIPLTPTLPQVLANRSPFQLLQFYKGSVTVIPIPAISNNAWAAAVTGQQYGYYIRRRSEPTLVQFKTFAGVALTSSLNPSVEAQAVTFTATITPSAATGTVQFFDGGVALGSSAAIAAGVATLSTSTLAVGPHTITAIYGGDAGHLGGNSPSLVQTVLMIASSTVVTSSLNPSTAAQLVTFTATVTPATSTGTVQFSDGTTLLFSRSTLSSFVPIVGGVATLFTTNLTVGDHPITAAYSGDVNTINSVSPVLTQTVKQVVSALVVTSSLNPSVATQAVTFTGTVTPSSATGTVRFSDGAAPIGSPVALTSGVALLTTSSLVVGAHTINAAYSGDANNATASAAVPQNVNKAATTVTAIPSVNPSVMTQSVTFTAHVVPASATGTVQFSDGSTPLGNAIVLSGGAASLSTSALTAGAHPIGVAYSGDPNMLPGVSAAFMQNVIKATSAVIVTPSVNPSNATQPVTFTATVTPSSATGTVQFSDGTTALGSPVPVSGGVAALTTSTLTVGAHPITASYSGDANTSTSISPAVTQNVIRLNSAVTLNSSPNPSVVGQVVTFTALIAPSPAIGIIVQFSEGATTLGTAVAAIGGLATLNISTLAVGAHSITAAFGGDPNTSANTSTPLVQTVKPAPTSVTVAPSVNPSTVGQAVTFTATITPSSATGSVKFTDGTTQLGTPVPVAGGTATFTTSSLTVGPHPIAAAYSGDTNNTASNSTAVPQTVNKVTSSLTVTTSGSPSLAGQPVVFTAHVVPASATGTVQFADNGTAFGAPVAVGGGAASATTSSLTVGAHSITATYSGDANDTPGVSPTLPQTVNRLPSVVGLTILPTSLTVGQAVQFTAAVTPASATGTVQFQDGSTPLGSPVTIASGSATLTISSLAAGTHPITAAYSGDPNTLPNTSPVTSVTVNKQTPTVSLNPSLNPSTFGQAVTFIAQVTPNSATGTVQFADGSTPLGSPVAVSAGAAAAPAPSLTPGTHLISAAYSGDAKTLAGSAPVLMQAVNKQASTVTVTSSGSPTTPGQTVTFTAKVTPPTATGTVQFFDTSPLTPAPVPIGTVVTLSAGAAAVSTSTLVAGTHPITAVYSGDAITAGSTSPAFQQSVTRVTPSVTLTSSPNPSVIGQTVTFTVKVAAAPAVPTGTIQLRDGTASLGGVLTLSGGGATLAIQIPTAGSHNITAIYSGDTANAAATSNTVVQVVNNPTIPIIPITPVTPITPISG